MDIAAVQEIQDAAPQIIVNENETCNNRIDCWIFAFKQHNALSTILFEMRGKYERKCCCFFIRHYFL